ncbi:MAG: rhomboid family intramembrane serine protease [Pseudomonadota bacterium]
MTPVVRNILVACVAAFLLQLVMGSRLEDLFALQPLYLDPPYGAGFHAWQLVTYAFLHGGFTHIIFNMFALYMFGPEIERLVGSRRFTVYYLVCVISAGLAQLAVQHFFERQAGPTVGASGGIFGVLLAFGLAFPHRRLMLIFPPIPMPAWLFVTLYGLVELYLGISGREVGVAHFAHLGGMVGGFLLILFWRYQRLSRP